MIWSQTGHFITFWTKHGKKWILLQKLLSLVDYLWIWHNKWKFRCLLVTQQLFCHFLNIKSKNFFDKSCSVWYAFWEFLIKSDRWSFIWLKSGNLVTLKTNHRITSCSAWWCLRIYNEKWNLSSQAPKISHFVTR